MDRRDSIKALVLGTVSAGVLLEACDTEDKKKTPDAAVASKDNVDDRMAEEVAYNKDLHNEKFFTDHEIATIVVLGDIIIPKDEVSGSASDAKVGDFIEFIVKDMPQHQTPMRGGLRWLDLQCLTRYEKPFKDCSSQQQIQMVDQIAYPKKAKPEMQQGVSFFSLMRNLTVTGFYTTKIGYEDVGFMGNRPNQWNGVPPEVLKQYNVAYTEKELKECVSYDKA
ncbi:MAG TPA: gluconate 2-dehydrogenase subunit 3 family protein [Flavitalea sp.]|nr:gluconate 2-dehydrogenase subunit 3 family protein [Flavitalea sp.]